MRNVLDESGWFSVSRAEQMLWKLWRPLYDLQMLFIECIYTHVLKNAGNRVEANIVVAR